MSNSTPTAPPTTTKSLHSCRSKPYVRVVGVRIVDADHDFETVICRPKLDSDSPFEILRWLRDEEVRLCLTLARAEWL